MVTQTVLSFFWIPHYSEVVGDQYSSRNDKVYRSMTPTKRQLLRGLFKVIGILLCRVGNCLVNVEERCSAPGNQS